MKLIYCRHCKDVVLLHMSERKCHCGKSKGRYTDEINAVVSGDNVLTLGIDNLSLYEAVRNHEQRPNGNAGIRFQAFVIPENAATVKRE